MTDNKTMEALKISKNNVYCYDPKYNKYRKMGILLADTFVKSVELKHYMVKKQGYGLQFDALQLFASKGIINVRVHENHTGDTYLSTVQQWLDHHDVADYGLGKQAFLPRSLMQREDKEKKEKEKHQLEILRAKGIQEKLF